MKSSAHTAGTGLVTVLLASLLANGCGYARQVRESVEPTAVPAMRSAQTLNPEAGRNRKVVAGLDGAPAKSVSDGYAKSFQRQNSQVGATESFQGMGGLSSN